MGLGNISQRDIARRAQISKTLVANISRKLQLGVTLSPQHRGNCGRKPVLTPHGMHILSKVAKHDRTATNEVIKRKMVEAGVQISTRTVRRRLIDLEFNSRRPVQKLKLTESMMKKRLEWAKEYQHFIEDDWKKVYCSCFNLINCTFC